MRSFLLTRLEALGATEHFLIAYLINNVLENWCSAFLKLIAPDKMSAFKPFCGLKWLKSVLNRGSFNFVCFYFKGMLLF